MQSEAPGEAREFSGHYRGAELVTAPLGKHLQDCDWTRRPQLLRGIMGDVPVPLWGQRAKHPLLWEYSPHFMTDDSGNTWLFSV